MIRLLLLSLLLFPSTIFTQNPDWQAKIDPELWALVQQSDSAVEFLVIMKDQADLSAAKNLRKKEAKGKFVFETLSSLAETTQRDLRDLLQLSGVPFQSFWVINALWVKGPKALLEQIAMMPETGRLELNPAWHLSRPKDDPESSLVEDRLTPRSWGLTKINADDVWALGYTGAGIVVGGQDTGYEWEHPAIKNRYRGWDGSTVNHNYNWHDAIHSLINGGGNSCGLNLNHPCDDNNHGTHTMGTMVGNVHADSIFGVAPDAEWMGCRNMEEGDGTPATYIECFEWFIAPTDLNNQNPNSSQAPHVINNSWGCPGSEGCNNSNFATMEAVVNNVRAAGIVVVVSAGNDGPGCSTVNSPAAIYNSSYSVGATASNDVIANFSSRGPVTVYTSLMKPDISAPGVAIVSCIGNNNNAGTYGYASWNGTSMAGPHIAGAVALILDARADLIGNVEAIENLINNTASPLFDTAPFCGSDNASSRPNNVYGWGRVDVLAAINQALPIELLSFKATMTSDGALLEWITATEQNCASFTVQRSLDGILWQNLIELPCKGNGVQAENRYAYTDPTRLKGVVYYRFQQRDHSGESYYSPVRVVNFSPTGYSLRISAAADKAYYEVVGENAADFTWLLDICALDGRIIQSRAVGYKGVLDMPKLPIGVYMATLRNPEGHLLTTEKLLWNKP